MTHITPADVATLRAALTKLRDLMCEAIEDDDGNSGCGQCENDCTGCIADRALKASLANDLEPVPPAPPSAAFKDCKTPADVAEVLMMMARVSSNSLEACEAMNKAAQLIDCQETCEHMMHERNREKNARLVAEAMSQARSGEPTFFAVKCLDWEKSLIWIIENTVQVLIRNLALEMLGQQRAALKAWRDGQRPPTEYEQKLAAMKKDFPNGI